MCTRLQTRRCDTRNYSGSQITARLAEFWPIVLIFTVANKIIATAVRNIPCVDGWYNDIPRPTLATISHHEPIRVYARVNVVLGFLNDIFYYAITAVLLISLLLLYIDYRIIKWNRFHHWRGIVLFISRAARGKIDDEDSSRRYIQDTRVPYDCGTVVVLLVQVRRRKSRFIDVSSSTYYYNKYRRAVSSINAQLLFIT